MIPTESSHRGLLAARRHPRGMTLVEMLVAMTLTLIMMAAVTQVFATLGQGVNGTRNTAELDDKVRSVAYRLRQDLAGATARMQPPLRPEQNLGYFELIEGPVTDLVTYLPDGTVFLKTSPTSEPYESAIGSDDRLLGDTDDILLFTTRSPAEPFSGKLGTRGIRSPVAEVIWYCRLTPGTLNPRLFTLYRRQRLVMAHPGAEPFVDTAFVGPARNAVDSGPPNAVPFTSWPDINNLTDVSCRLQAGYAIPNTLADLTKRENRFCRLGNFPYVFNSASTELAFEPGEQRYGEDVILTNVIGFDVRVLDRGAIVRVAERDNVNNPPTEIGFAVTPGDPGYATGTPTNMTGAYVDLNWGQLAMPVPIGDLFPPVAPNRTAFETLGVAIRRGNGVGNLLGNPTYDTWSTHYEYNSLDDDGDGTVDQGTDGLDSTVPINGAIDEAAEAETSPPYPATMEGIEVRIRCYEPSSRQVRQITVRNTFVPH